MAFNQLKKWVGTQLWSTFMTEYNENIDELNRVIADLEAHMADSANKHINESGSLADGWYIKFDDGTMVYRGFFTYTGPCNASVGTLYRSNTLPSPTTPSDFVGDVIRKFVPVPHSSGTDAVIFGIEFQSKANRADIFTPIAHDNITVKIGFEYTGRWK